MPQLIKFLEGIGSYLIVIGTILLLVLLIAWFDVGSRAVNIIWAAPLGLTMILSGIGIVILSDVLYKNYIDKDV